MTRRQEPIYVNAHGHTVLAYTNADGVTVERPISAGLATVAFEEAVPARSVPSWKGKNVYEGDYWAATTRRLGVLEAARDTVATEKQVEERAKEALTELFEAVRDEKTPIMVKRLVSDINEIVRTVRYDGWQAGGGEQGAGEKEVRRAVRRVLYVQYKLRDEDVFEKVVGCIREY